MFFSRVTTDLGPRLSATTVQDYGGEAEFAKVDFGEARLGIRVTGASAITSQEVGGAEGLLIEGEMMFLSEATLGSLGIRSGNTVYTFLSESGGAI